MKKIKTTPAGFAEAFIEIDGMPFRFVDKYNKYNWRKYLLPIYNNPYEDMILKCGRQVEKSTTLAVKGASHSALKPHFGTLYVSPTSKQTRKYSNQKFRKIINTSPLFSKYFTNKYTTDQVYEVTFSNFAEYHMGYAYHSADSVRGVSVDMITFDEFQDLLSDHIPVIKEAASASDYEINIYSGTPKTYNNHIEKRWQDSTQNIWVIPCKSCGIGNRMDKDPKRMISKQGLVCKKCGSSINTKNGYWHELQPDARLKGYHISQLQIGRNQRKKKWDKIYYEKYLKYPEAKLHNEVFGLSFDSADKPMTKTKLKKVATGPWLYELKRDTTKKNPLYMGVDWGENKGSFNVAVIGGFVDGTFRVFHIKKFDHKESQDPDLVLDYLHDMFNIFKCRVMACDHGAGHKENIRLKKMISPERVWEIYYSSNQKKLWDWKPKGEMYVVNRSKIMSDTIDKIEREELQLPQWEELEKRRVSGRALYEDFTSLNKEYSETLRAYKYDHDGPDDVFQALVYCRLAAHIDQGVSIQ